MINVKTITGIWKKNESLKWHKHKKLKYIENFKYSENVQENKLN